MRVLRLEGSGEGKFEEFHGENIPPYAILSHTWEADEQELDISDMRSGAGKAKSDTTSLSFVGGKPWKMAWNPSVSTAVASIKLAPPSQQKLCYPCFDDIRLHSGATLPCRRLDSRYRETYRKPLSRHMGRAFPRQHVVHTWLGAPGVTGPFIS
jgi:hypothetical protein